METEQAYYLTYDIDGDNACRLERELIVNCCGLTNMTRPFKTQRLNGREDFYIIYLLSGNLCVLTDKGVEVMKPGQMITYFPHTPCVYKNRKSAPVQYYWAHFTGSRAQELLKKCDIYDKEIVGLQSIDEIALDFEHLFQEFSKRQPFFDFLSPTILVSIITKTAKSRAEGKNVVRKKLQLAITYIHQNYKKKNISVEYLAGLEHLSTSRFRTIFKETTGLSPKDYILTHKINHAKQLLAQTDISIKEIALETGYTDQLYFSRMFRSKTGYTPSEYKRFLIKKNL